MRGAQLDEYSYVLNVFEVPYINVIPWLILIEDVESVAGKGDYWDGERFIHPEDPDFPPHP